MIKAIMACDSNYGIGRNGTLPWPSNKEDLRHFKNQTDGHIVVMGRKTWDDPCFPAPLKNRENYVITRTRNNYNGASIINRDIKETILTINNRTDKDVWVIGGSTIINLCSDIIEEFRLTIIPGDFQCDTFLKFPFYNFDLVLDYKGEETDNLYHVFRRKL